MHKKAMCVGINDYPGFDNDLAGCVNDARDWDKALTKRGFSCVTLLDAEATRNNILSGLGTLLKTSGDGDVVAFTYSGHGTWVPDKNGDEPDGRDECLCPYDMGRSGANLIIDDEIGAMLLARPAGVRVVLITDSCHSGTVFREMLPPAEDATRVLLRRRYIPPTAFLVGRELKRAEFLALTPAKSGPSDDPLPGVVHVSGCSDLEFSYDTIMNGRPNGAMTGSSIRILKGRKAATMTYAEFFTELRKRLPSTDYQQTPRFNCPDDLKDLPLFS